MGRNPAPTLQKCSVGCSVFRQCVLEVCSIPNQDTGCRTCVLGHNATVQVSLNSTPTIVMLQAQAEILSKHNVVAFRCLCSPFIATLAVQTLIISSQVLDALRTFHSVVTVSNSTIVHRMIRNRLNLLCYGS
ncbi:hypothetical protein TNCV_1999501 [Trichonephila clavipes]|nr:hypothetical protein TNCV_1999501 [Trichonephila clavipes]